MPIALILLLAAPGASLATYYSNTAKGWFYYCEPGVCTFWSSWIIADLEETTTLWHSENQTEYDIAPFQDSVILHNGRDMYNEGLYPLPGYSNDIYDAAGTLIRSGYIPSGPPCWSYLINGNDLFAISCDQYGFVIPTSTYPPGRSTSYWSYVASGASGGFFASASVTFQ
ncbi:MAG: hypothetical protein IVW53_00535 [Chloroflexi bacterium]|nr:hypothetical protein [Chloroflexota bacterium]